MSFIFTNQVSLNLPKNLDYAFLMMYAQWRGVYYVQLEDDILTKVKNFHLITNCALKSDQKLILIIKFIIKRQYVSKFIDGTLFQFRLNYF